MYFVEYVSKFLVVNYCGTGHYMITISVNGGDSMNLHVRHFPNILVILIVPVGTDAQSYFSWVRTGIFFWGNEDKHGRDRKSKQTRTLANPNEC